MSASQRQLLAYLARLAQAGGASQSQGQSQEQQPGLSPAPPAQPGAGLNFGQGGAPPPPSPQDDPRRAASLAALDQQTAPPPATPAAQTQAPPLASTPAGEVASDAQAAPRPGAGLNFGPPPIQGFPQNPAAASPTATPMPAQSGASGAAPPPPSVPGPATPGLDFSQLPPEMRDAAAQIQALRSAPPPEDHNGRLHSFGATLAHTLPGVLERLGDAAARDPENFGAADFIGGLGAGALFPAAAAGLGNAHMRATDERMGREEQIGKARLNFAEQAQEQGAMADVRSKNANAVYDETRAHEATHPTAKPKHYSVEKAANGYFAVNAADPTDRFAMPDMGGAEPDYEVREVSDGHGGKRLVAVNKRNPTEHVDLNLATSDAKGHPIKASEVPRSMFGLKNENEITDEARSAISKISNKTRAQDVNPVLLHEGSPYRNGDGTPNMDLVWANITTGKLHLNEAFPTVTTAESNDVEQAVASGRSRIRQSQAPRAALVDRYSTIIERVSTNPPEGEGTQEVTLDALHTKMRDLLDRLDSKNPKERAQAQKDIETFFQALQHVRIR